MNNFRDNLHFAFYSMENFWASEDLDRRNNPEYQANKDRVNTYGNPSQENLENTVQDLDDLVEETAQDLVDVQGSVVLSNMSGDQGNLEQGSEVITEVDNEIWRFRDVVWNIGRESMDRYQSDKLTTPEQLGKARKRHNENYKNWNKNVKEWYKDLLKTLDKNRYFESSTAQSFEKIRKMYVSEIEKQYEDYVWGADDKAFDNVKDKLFTKKMWDSYPANVVYKKLNNDAEIFQRDLKGREAYSVIIDESENNENGQVESEKWSYKKNFLSEKLPNCLCKIKSTPAWAKILQRTPIIWKSIDRPSEKDKEGIKDFVKLTEKMSKLKWSWDTPELILIDVFENAQTDWTQRQWQDAFEQHNIKVEGENSFLRKVSKVYNESYAKAQSTDDLNIYLWILKVVKDYGWFDKTIATFKDDVEAYSEKKDKKAWEKLKENNPDLYGIAEKCNVDYESALRLAEMDPESFKSRNVLRVLANVDNDKWVSQSDVWASKSWQQFLQMASIVDKKLWEGTSLNNLLAHAKLLNKSQNLWIDENSFTKEEINKWNKQVILLLQSIVSQPWEDFWTLLEFWTDAKKKDEKMAEEFIAQETLRSNKYDAVKEQQIHDATDDLIKEMDIDWDGINKIEWVQAATPEWLHEAVAWALYTAYTDAIGLWARISFDEWVKWVALNGWFQVGDSWVSLWLSLSYRADIDLWKWWKLTPWVSIGYVPFMSFEGDFTQWMNTGAWLEVAKKWINDKGIAKRFGVELNYTRILGTTNVFSAFVWESINKLQWIEDGMEDVKNEFKWRSSSVLEDIMKSSTVLDFSDDDCDRNIRTAIRSQIEKSLNDEDSKLLDKTGINSLTDYTMRFLVNFNWMDISDESKRDEIAGKMSEELALARKYAALNKMDDKAYFSWWRLWASLVQLWTWWTVVWHAWVSWTKHQADGYKDNSRSESRIWAEKFDDRGELTDAMINEINIYLKDNEKLSINGDYVTIPQSLLNRVYIHPDMKWLIKHDESGNILIHKQTRLDMPRFAAWVATRSVRLNIGWGKDKDMVSLNWIKNDSEWFADGDIDTTKLTWKEWFTMDLLERGLDWLRKKVPELESFHFDNRVLERLKGGHKWLITMEEKGSNSMDIRVNEVKDNDALPLTIEYKWHKWAEMMSEEAQEVASHMYGEAQKVTSNALYNISHNKNNKLYPDYDKFAHAVIEQKYNEARDTISKMLPEMDKYINQYQQKNNKVDFNQVAGALQKLEWEELWKALMSINNIFARVSSVHGGTDWKYHFVWYEGENRDEMVNKSMWSIVEARAKEISWKINRSDLDPETKAAYQSLIAFAEQDRKVNSKKYEDSSKEAKTLYNAIWINLWNRFSIENPLFNPEVYEDSIIDNPKFEWRDTLLLHALDIIASNETLMDPIKEQLWIKWLVEKITIDNDQLILDIWWEKVKISAQMKFAYFAQCVNHMLIIDNIHAETGDNVSVDLWNSVLWDGVLRESRVKHTTSTITTSLDLAAKVGSWQSWVEEAPEDDATTTMKADEEDIQHDWSTNTGAENNGQVSWSWEEGGPWDKWTEEWGRSEVAPENPSNPPVAGQWQSGTQNWEWKAW